MSSDDGKIFGYSILGLGAGLYWFIKGFQIFREYRVVEDTPEIAIRSVAMGLVHIHGKAQGDQTVPSPVTKTPCYFYKVDIEKWQTDSKGNGSWRHYRTDANGLRFYLNDASGRVLMDAHGAEYDLNQSGRRETRWSTGARFGKLQSGIDNPQAVSALAELSDDHLNAYAGSVVSSGFSLDGALGNLSLQHSFSLGGGGGLGGMSSLAYRFTEYCILPEHWYDVTGTCAENPQAKDEHDRNLIMKGQNEPTFLISWRAEKELEKTMRRRAALYVFGGAALAVFCLAILLAKLGWL